MFEGGTMIDGLKSTRADETRVTSMACGIVLCCYLVCVVMMTMYTRHQRSVRLTRRD
jgi:hypothetical protein